MARLRTKLKFPCQRRRYIDDLSFTAVRELTNLNNASIICDLQSDSVIMHDLCSKSKITSL
jgi:hypothetical protein